MTSGLIRLVEDCVGGKKVIHGAGSEKEQAITITFAHSMFPFDSIPGFVILSHMSIAILQHKYHV